MGLLSGMGSLKGLSDGAAAAGASDKPFSSQITDVLNAASNAVATTVPVIQGKLPPPGYMVDPRTGKFVPNPNSNPSGGGGMPGGGSSLAQSLPAILGVAAVIGIGYFAIKRFSKKR